MVQHRIAEVGDLLRSGARDLPSNAVRVWDRVRGSAAKARSSAAAWVASRTGRAGPGPDMDGMTKEELMELARQEQLRGRSSMTKAQLAAALRKLRAS
ncbi:Rho termination factor N-terminal domain-containing protein [Nocardioides sp.]|uniref:Rho termination factor N-terminal domain-containing protein n=1 Tax=Nocardioides sp. TaxID=35761 RepID=UPI002ED58106